MKKELLLSVALAGLMSGNVMADHHEGKDHKDGKKMEKNGCNGKNGCEGKKKEKHSCEGKNGCEGKKAHKKGEGESCGSNGCGN